VERDVDLRIDAVEVVEHLHLEVVVAHREVTVFGHDEINSDYVGVRGSYFKAEEGLREDLLRWETAEDLIEPVDADGTGSSVAVTCLRAGGRWWISVAELQLVTLTFCIRELFRVGRDFVAEAGE
jgi:hypothetical protein